MAGNKEKISQISYGEVQYKEVSNRFAAFEELGADVDINSDCEMIKENIKISAKEGLGYYELKKYKP
jgi:hypothetical protein